MLLTRWLHEGVRHCSKGGRAVLLMSLLLLVALGATWRQKPLAEPPIVLQARALAGTDRMEAIGVLEDYLAGGPAPELAPWVVLNAGEQRRLYDDPQGARAHFKRLKDGYWEHPLSEAAALGLALVDGGEQPSGNHLATLGLLGAEGAPPTMEADRHRLLALAAHRTDQADKARRHVEQALGWARQADDPEVARRVAGAVGAISEANDDQPPPVPEEFAAHGALERAETALEAGHADEARRIAEGFLATFPDSPSARAAAYLLERLENGALVDPRKVGVLLPMSGTYGPPGLQLKDAITLANEHRGSPMRLVFKDTRGDPEEVRAALEQLVLRDGAVAVLGPLLKEEAVEAAETAEALRVPLVALSQADDLTRGRHFVMRAFLTPRQQVEGLLDHLFETRGLRRFAILAPDTPYGHMTSALFATEVARREGAVVRSVFYDGEAGDLRDAARVLANKDYTARAGEFRRLKRDAKDRGMNPAKVVLPPLVDFDAIFIPDNHQRVLLVASALAYEEFAVGRFKPRRTDEPVLLAGLNGWHDDTLALDGGSYLRGAVLVDAFYPDDDSPAVASFTESFRERFQRQPGVMDALAYDAGALLAEAMAEGPEGRRALLEALKVVEVSSSVTGIMGFDEEGEARRHLRILEVGPDRIEPWTPPEPPVEQ